MSGRDAESDTSLIDFQRLRILRNQENFGRSRKARFAKAARIPLDEEPPGRGQD
jgi:purine nucleoside permease